MAYDENQKAVAEAAQALYRDRVAAAWAEEAKAAKVRYDAIRRAEALRDAVLEDAGVNVNDLRDLLKS